jgi:hypothetical protein
LAWPRPLRGFVAGRAHRDAVHASNAQPLGRNLERHVCKARGSLSTLDTGSVSASDDIARYRANLQAEIDGGVVYRAMSLGAGSPQLTKLYGLLAETEERHAQLWRSRLTDAGVPIPIRPTARANSGCDRPPCRSEIRRGDDREPGGARPGQV